MKNCLKENAKHTCLSETQRMHSGKHGACPPSLAGQHVLCPQFYLMQKLLRIHSVCIACSVRVKFSYIEIALTVSLVLTASYTTFNVHEF